MRGGDLLNSLLAILGWVAVVVGMFGLFALPLAILVYWPELTGKWKVATDKGGRGGLHRAQQRPSETHTQHTDTLRSHSGQAAK